MSYHDLYVHNHGQASSSQHHYNDSVTDFNPYATNPFEQNDGWNGDNTISYPPRQLRSAQGLAVEPNRRSVSGFEQGEFTPKEKALRGVKQYRYDYRGNLWSKGGRGHCCGRFCCCILMSTVLLVVSIVLTIILWIRPPNVVVGNVSLAANPLKINAAQKQLTIDFAVNISVSNPNSLGIAFQKIEADIFYPINNTRVGGGELQNIVFKPNQQTNVTFPLAIDYDANEDPQYKILTDLATKCGVNGGTQSPITVNYKITLGLRVLLFVISPVISNTVTFDCPASADQIESFLQSLGISNLIPSL
jgi:LEA14-like dessication related protein